MLSIHLLVENDSLTIEAALDSIQNHLPTASYQILIGDTGSTDGTADYCAERGCVVHKVDASKGLHAARNRLITLGEHEWQFYLEPWEVVVKGHDHLYHRARGDGSPLAFQVVQSGTVSKQVRMWKRSQGLFVNPAFERPDVEAKEVGGMIKAGKRASQSREAELVEEWVKHSPAEPSPHYYKACLLLGQRKWPEFESAAQAYLFREDPKALMPMTMTRYYLGSIQCYVKKDAQKAIQYALSCIAARPLMSEFWCLLADVYYHLLRKYDKAIIFYRNALDLGRQRLAGDDWPMELAKYRDYPEKMIASCEGIMSQSRTIKRITA